MKNAGLVIVGLFFVLAGECFSMILEQDFKGSKDHPLLSRMPDFRISDCKDTEFGGYRFIGTDKKYGMIEGQ
jgi:hypothetical protein